MSVGLFLLRTLLFSLITLACLLVGAGTPAFAQSGVGPVPDTASCATCTALPPATVTATRTHQASAHVTVIDREDLEASGAATVADALEARAPLSIRRHGPSGLATVALRGASSAQTLLLLDGHPLTDPQLGMLDLTLLPTILLGSVEVHQGAGAARYGSGAVGGVVHLRSLYDGPRLRLATEAGPWGQRRLGATAASQKGRWHATAAAEAARADDDFHYADRSRLNTPARRRTGWDHSHTSGYASLGYTQNKTTLRAAVLATDSERGLGGTDSVGARQWDRHVRLWARGAHSTRLGPLEGGLFMHRGQLRYASPFPATRTDALDDTGLTTSAGADIHLYMDAIAGWSVTPSASLSMGRADHPSLSQGAADIAGSLALSATRSTGRLHLFPALRLDGYAPSVGQQRLVANPHLGASLQPLATSAFRLKASVGSAFRMPTLNDRFWQPGGNPDLLPERAWTADAGFAYTPPRYRFELTGFATTARDQIVWRLTPSGFWAPQNLSHTRTTGAEASAEGTWTLSHSHRLEAGLAATYTDARDRSDPTAASFDRPLRYIPRQVIKSWGGVQTGALSLDVSARYLSRRYNRGRREPWPSACPSHRRARTLSLRRVGAACDAWTRPP